MDRVGVALSCALAVVLIGCPQGEDSQQALKVFDPYLNDLAAVPEHEDWYPETVDPPEGTEYPCRLLPLPEDLKGLPNGDRKYINHVFSEVVTLARANLRVAQLMGTAQQEGAIQSYESTAEQAITTLEAEVVPKGLEDFHATIMGAIGLQRLYFHNAGEIYDEKVQPLIQEGLSEANIERERDNARRESRNILEGSAASAKLAGAWNQLFLRYDGHWDKTVQESISLHLRAMDL